MAYILFEDSHYIDLLPLSFLRPVYDLRAGIFTFRERWAHHLKSQKIYHVQRKYLRPKFGDISLDRQENMIWLNGRFVPNPELLRLIKDVPPQTAYIDREGVILAANFSPHLLPHPFDGIINQDILTEVGLKVEKVLFSSSCLNKVSDIFLLNGQLIRHDFNLVTSIKKSVDVNDAHTIIYGKDNLFVEEGANIRAAVINAEDGPIFIGKGANVQEGALIKRPHAICEYASVSMGAKLRGDSTIGPYCKAGGEVTNSVLMSYSNKAHDGYLGNSVLGYWCNMGADSNNSNLKNNYTALKQWNYRDERVAQTELMFCGLIMGDHSKCGINSMFNTGTVIGVSANIFDGGYPPKFVPSFSWGGSHGMTTYHFSKACEVAERVMHRRKLIFKAQDKDIFQYVFKQTEKYREHFV